MAGLESLVQFVAIVEAGSLAAAARALALPKSSVSRRLAALERDLDARLIERTTRKLRLTEAGERLYARCAPLVMEARAVEADFLRRADALSGRVRLTATGAFGRMIIAPVLAGFMERHPAIDAELLLLDRSVDLVGEGFDLAVRMGPLPDSALVHRKLVGIRRVLCAAPAYLERVGGIGTIKDLQRRQALATIEGNRWTFERPGRPLALALSPRFRGNDLSVLHELARRGCGVALLPRYLAADDLAAGVLEEVLPELRPVAGAAHLVWPSSRHQPARARTLIDWLVASIGPDL